MGSTMKLIASITDYISERQWLCLTLIAVCVCAAGAF